MIIVSNSLHTTFGKDENMWPFITYLDRAYDGPPDRRGWACPSPGESASPRSIKGCHQMSGSVPCHHLDEKYNMYKYQYVMYLSRHKMGLTMQLSTNKNLATIST